MILVHDYFNIQGGGERLISELSIKLKCDVITVSKSLAYEENSNIKDHGNSILKKYFGKIYFFLFYLFFYKGKNKEEYNYVLYSGSYSVLNIGKIKAKKKIAYVHSLPKKIYNDKYSSELNIWIFPVKWLLKKIYINKYNKFDIIIFNSNFTKNIFLENIKLSSEIKTSVLYPFFDKKFQIQMSVDNELPDKYFLFNSRHETNKRVIEITSFFSKYKKYKLVLTNKGSLTKYLKEKFNFNKNIIFTDNVSDKEYITILQNCFAVIMTPKNEDFGMAALEALACKKPVIAVQEGGLKEIFGDSYEYFVDISNFENSMQNKIILLEKRNYNFIYQNQISKFEIDSFILNLNKILIH